MATLTDKMRTEIRGYEHRSMATQSSHRLPQTFSLPCFESERVKSAAFQSYRSWANNEDMQGSFEKGEEQIKRITALQTPLRKDDGAVQVHVMAELGIGKTRCVLEAIGAVDLSPLAIYCSDAGAFKDGYLSQRSSVAKPPGSRPTSWIGIELWLVKVYRPGAWYDCAPALRIASMVCWVVSNTVVLKALT